MDSIEDIAGRLDRAADRYRNANDFGAEHDARQAAAQARRARTPLEAEQIEAAFFRTRAPGPSQVLPNDAPADLAQNADCLGNLFGGRGGMRGGRSRWSTSRTTYRPTGVRHYFTSGQYNQYSVRDAIGRHVPPGYDANTYAQQVALTAGIAPAALVGALTAVQVAALADAIENDPNWRRANQASGGMGNTTTYSDRSSTSDSNTSWDSSSNRPEDTYSGGGGRASGGGASGDFGGGADFGRAESANTLSAPTDNS